MRQGASPREVWKRYRSSVTVPGCPCCGSVKLSRELKEAQRRAKARERLLSRAREALIERDHGET